MSRARGAAPDLVLPPSQRGPRCTLLDFTRRLAAGEGIGQLNGSVARRPVTGGPAPRILFLRNAIRRLVVSWLTHRGGYRRIQVAGEERVLSGRLWDSAPWRAAGLSFGPCSLQSLVSAYNFAAGREAGLEWRLEDLEGGDLVLRHILLQSLRSGGHELGLLRSEDDVIAQVTLASPLSSLYEPDLGGLDEGAIELLQSPGNSVLVRFLEGDIAARWLASEQARERMPAWDALQRYDRFANALEAWVAGALKRERPDLLLPLAVYFQRLLRLRGPREEILRRISGRVLIDFYAASDQQRFQRTLARIYLLGAQLDESAKRARARSYIDRSAADKVFLAGYQATYRDISEDLRAIGRRFGGEIG